MMIDQIDINELYLPQKTHTHFKFLQSKVLKIKSHKDEVRTANGPVLTMATVCMTEAEMRARKYSVARSVPVLTSYGL